MPAVRPNAEPTPAVDKTPGPGVIIRNRMAKAKVIIHTAPLGQSDRNRSTVVPNVVTGHQRARYTENAVPAP